MTEASNDRGNQRQRHSVIHAMSDRGEQHLIEAIIDRQSITAAFDVRGNQWQRHSMSEAISGKGNQTEAVNDRGSQ